MYFRYLTFFQMLYEDRIRSQLSSFRIFNFLLLLKVEFSIFIFCVFRFWCYESALWVIFMAHKWTRPMNATVLSYFIVVTNMLYNLHFEWKGLANPWEPFLSLCNLHLSPHNMSAGNCRLQYSNYQLLKFIAQNEI